MSLKTEFAQRLKNLRKLRNMTQEQLAETVNVDSRHISYIETANSFPSCELIERLCKALDVSYSELFSFESSCSREELILGINERMQHLGIKELSYIYKISSKLQ